MKSSKIIFDTPDGLSGGIITIAAADNQPAKVHDWMSVLYKTRFVWAPVWTTRDNENPARYLKCPTDLQQPHIIAVDNSDIIYGTDLQARKLTTAAVTMSDNLGYEQFSTL